MRRKENKIIIDTNIWISYLISNKYKFLDTLLINKTYKLVFCEELLDEFIEVIQRPKFEKSFSKNDIENLLQLFNNLALFYKLKTSLTICRDKKDNFLLSLAVDSKSDYLLTGDNDLLELKKIEKTQIITLDEFKNLL